MFQTMHDVLRPSFQQGKLISATFCRPSNVPTFTLVNSHNCKLIAYSLRRNLATLAPCSDVMSSQVESQNCGFLRNNECRLIVCCIRFLDSLLGNLKATGICFKVRYIELLKNQGKSYCHIYERSSIGILTEITVVVKIVILTIE
ncbi:hypothetical protein CAJAP_04847 [Camponotus japonicus]